MGYFDTHRPHLAALAELGSSYRPGGGRRFDELGLRPEVRDELAALDPAPILRAGQRSGEFGDFPVDSVAIALRGAINAAVEHVMHNPEFDLGSYGEDLALTFGRVVSKQ